MVESGATRHEGGCLCGRIRYRFAGDPLLSAICHCRHCQRQSGSAFSIVCAVADGDFEMAGDTRVFVDAGDSGGHVDRHFCGDCGSPLISIASAIPGLTLIKAGTLDRPEGWPPTLEVYCDRALPWVAPSAADRRPGSNLED